MDVVITAGEAIELDVWDSLCDLKGWNVWIVSEGQMSDSDRITLTTEEAFTIGLLEDMS